MSLRLPAAILAVAAAAGAAWLVLRPSETPSVAVEPADGVPLRPVPQRRDPAPLEVATAPREGLAEAAERLPEPERPITSARLRFPKAPEQGTVSGEEMRAALLEVPGLYLRWDTAEAKEAFLAATFRVLPDAYSPREAPLGTPLQVVLAVIREAGFAARLEPPRVVIGPRP